MENLEAREKSREKVYLREIKSLRRQLLIQTRRTASLESVVRRLSNKSPGKLNQEIDKSVETEDDGNGRIKSAEKPSREAMQTHRIRRAENENPVAFFATLSQHLNHAGAHQSITFDNVVTNIGNAYNSHFGSFTAPVSGTYVFSVTLFSMYHSNYHAQFVKNGQGITWLYSTFAGFLLQEDFASVAVVGK
ncbi:heavy metal-binding protein HIP-like [Mercenaria mercenaria]|uniref:heavy metal-binding protein HIP-like n=1 Tax=Mercenaria mercenaria TaxID=6596 RepID=UPI00234E8F00|nr:heavy metal-binding protein HIP-like [Mercenaria mercenaria]